MLYFAYGSNLNHRQMLTRCPNAQYICAAYLKGYRLVFKANGSGRGVADIEKTSQPESIVYGGVWEVNDKDVRSLDRYEGCPFVYNKRDLDVTIGNGRKLSCITYYMTVHRYYEIPSKEYFFKIKQGYKECALPVEHLNKCARRALKLYGTEFNKLAKKYFQEYEVSVTEKYNILGNGYTKSKKSSKAQKKNIDTGMTTYEKFTRRLNSEIPENDYNSDFYNTFRNDYENQQIVTIAGVDYIDDGTGCLIQKR